MQLTSSAFVHKGLIPSKYTCDGENVSPELLITTIPEGTKTLALIMEDPDVPKTIRKDGMWDHWIVWNIPQNATTLTEGIIPGVEGTNTGGELGYMGPCPPGKEHRYYFTLYALDIMLNLPEGSTKQKLLEAMKGHILTKTTLMGRYVRQNDT